MSHIPATDGPVYDQRCTADERTLLDILATADQPPEPDMQAMLALVDAQEAVITAATNETNAEAMHRDAQRRAFTARTGASARAADANEARLNLVDARDQRRAAVANLLAAQARKD